MHSRSAWSNIITVIILLLPNTTSQSARGLLLLRDLGFCLGSRGLCGRRLGAFTWCRGTLAGGWTWCRGSGSSTTGGGSACTSTVVPAK
ncbi:hypothetical protein DEU56DRAFT_817015 [Suillus clintonianus]|uniref:uncharacterized protein n=1 Tax=Suillus clintonianus TaxID=1904413 RepID=UPI001B87E741|nr:uncharacterized protein DEU56DRAFT_817015 [Suillus clintonianus]KAG2129614.1 hypothetical protein DEU56DRAFT_817015 [Suillus clintonianus]